MSKRQPKIEFDLAQKTVIADLLKFQGADGEVLARLASRALGFEVTAGLIYRDIRDAAAGRFNKAFYIERYGTKKKGG